MTTAPVPELNTDERIGTNVHYLLWARRIQQKDLAEAMELTPTVVSKKLRGTSGWYADQVEAAANFLGVPVERLFAKPTAGKVLPKLAVIDGGGMKANLTLPMLHSVTMTD